MGASQRVGLNEHPGMRCVCGGGSPAPLGRPWVGGPALGAGAELGEGSRQSQLDDGGVALGLGQCGSPLDLRGTTVA